MKTKYQTFDVQDMPEELKRKTIDYYESRFSCNNSYVSVYEVEELQEDFKELYDWFVENGYKKNNGKVILLIWW